MPGLKRYRRRDDAIVAAVRIDLDTDGFTYRKWGGEQVVRPSDWLVDNGREVYPVDAGTFAETYAPIAPGQYRKTARVWARQAEAEGRVASTSGWTRYAAGDMVVFASAAQNDGWAVPCEDFLALYRPDEWPRPPALACLGLPWPALACPSAAPP